MPATWQELTNVKMAFQGTKYHDFHTIPSNWYYQERRSQHTTNDTFDMPWLPQPFETP
jgi:hypothetical protein